MIGQSVAKAAGQVADAAFDIAVTRQKALDESLAVRKATELRIAADALAAEGDVEFANFDGDPNDRATTMRARYEDLFTKTIEDVKSPGARKLLERHGQELIGTYTINEAKKGRANQATLAAKNTLDTVNLLAVDAANVGRSRTMSSTQRYMAVQGLLQQGEVAYQAGYQAYSVDDRHTLVKQIPESIAKSFLMNLVTHNPEEVQGFIESGAFDSVLDPKERKSVLDDARSAIPKAIERREVEQLQQFAGEHLELYKAAVNQEPDALQRVMQSKAPGASLVKDMILKGKKAAVDDYATLTALVGRIDALYDKNKKTGAREKISRKTQLEDFQKVLDFAMQAEIDGKLKPSTVEGQIDNLMGPYYAELVKQNRGTNAGDALGFAAVATVMPAWQVARQALKYFVQNNKRVADGDMEGRMLSELTARFNRATIRTSEDAARLAQEIIHDEATAQSPGLATIPAGANKTQRPDRTQLNVQSGKTDTKNAVPLKGTGVETKIVPSKTDPSKRYRVTFKNGKPVGKPELINE